MDRSLPLPFLWGGWRRHWLTSNPTLQGDRNSRSNMLPQNNSGKVIWNSWVYCKPHRYCWSGVTSILRRTQSGNHYVNTVKFHCLIQLDFSDVAIDIGQVIVDIYFYCRVGFTTWI